jgi:hypothetical protein
VLDFMEQEAEQSPFTVPVSKAQERTEVGASVEVCTVEKSEGKSLVTTGQGNLIFNVS